MATFKIVQSFLLFKIEKSLSLINSKKYYYVIIVTKLLGVAMLKKILEFLNPIKTGEVQKIDLTFGGAGNQVMTINGINYATWIDYKQWPKIGTIVNHKPYKRVYRGKTMLCTNIIFEEK